MCAVSDCALAREAHTARQARRVGTRRHRLESGNRSGASVAPAGPSPASAIPLKTPPMHSAPAHAASGRHLTKLAFGALGVVYGDIGTSPLYSLKECVTAPHGVAATHDNILGLLSLVFWSISFVVSVKYLLYVMRADNDGEGGVLALMALALGTHDA